MHIGITQSLPSQGSADICLYPSTMTLHAKVVLNTSALRCGRQTRCFLRQTRRIFTQYSSSKAHQALHHLMQAPHHPTHRSCTPPTGVPPWTARSFLPASHSTLVPERLQVLQEVRSGSRSRRCPGVWRGGQLGTTLRAKGVGGLPQLLVLTGQGLTLQVAPPPAILPPTSYFGCSCRGTPSRSAKRLPPFCPCISPRAGPPRRRSVRRRCGRPSSVGMPAIVTR